MTAANVDLARFSPPELEAIIDALDAVIAGDVELHPDNDLSFEELDHLKDKVRGLAAGRPHA